MRGWQGVAFHSVSSPSSKGQHCHSQLISLWTFLNGLVGIRLRLIILGNRQHNNSSLINWQQHRIPRSLVQKVCFYISLPTSPQVLTTGCHFIPCGLLLAKHRSECWPWGRIMRRGLCSAKCASVRIFIPKTNVILKRKVLSKFNTIPPYVIPEGWRLGGHTTNRFWMLIFNRIFYQRDLFSLSYACTYVQCWISSALEQKMFVEEINESLLQNNRTFLYFFTIYCFFKSQYSCFHLRTSNLGFGQDSSKIIEA